MRLLCCVFTFLLIVNTTAEAQNLPSTMGEYINKENENWRKAYQAYGKECLPEELEAGAFVPPEISVEALNCYLRKINEFVKEDAVATDDLNTMLDIWFQSSMDVREGKITLEESEKIDKGAWYDYVKKRDKALEEIYR